MPRPLPDWLIAARKRERAIVRLGRRIANVSVAAWQDDETKPAAAANLKFLIER